MPKCPLDTSPRTRPPGHVSPAGLLLPGRYLVYAGKTAAHDHGGVRRVPLGCGSQHLSLLLDAARKAKTSVAEDKPPVTCLQGRGGAQDRVWELLQGAMDKLASRQPRRPAWSPSPRGLPAFARPAVRLTGSSVLEPHKELGPFHGTEAEVHRTRELGGVRAPEGPPAFSLWQAGSCLLSLAGWVPGKSVPLSSLPLPRLQVPARGWEPVGSRPQAPPHPASGPGPLTGPDSVAGRWDPSQGWRETRTEDAGPEAGKGPVNDPEGGSPPPPVPSACQQL